MGKVVSARLSGKCRQTRNSWGWVVVLGLVWAAGCALVKESRAAEQQQFITNNTIRSRSLALAGAYISMEDDLSAMLWNPAAYGNHSTRREVSFRLYVQPLAPLIAAHQFREVDLRWKQDDRLTLEESLLALAFLLKGATFCTSTLSFGIIGFEESLDRQPSARFFDFRSAAAAYCNVLAVNIRLAPTVSLGAAATLYYKWNEHESHFYGEGYSFGVLLKPNPKMNVGLTYFNLPQDAADSRRRLERIEDQTVNGGLSYYPDDKTILSLDLRNLNNDERAAAREIHLGVERVFLKHFALRTGYFRRKFSDPADHILTLGIGVGRFEYMLGQSRASSRLDVLSYTYIREQHKVLDGSHQDLRNWHTLSLLLRIGS